MLYLSTDSLYLVGVGRNAHVIQFAGERYYFPNSSPGNRNWRILSGYFQDQEPVKRLVLKDVNQGKYLTLGSRGFIRFVQEARVVSHEW